MLGLYIRPALVICCAAATLPHAVEQHFHTISLTHEPHYFIPQLLILLCFPARVSGSRALAVSCCTRALKSPAHSSASRTALELLTADEDISAPMSHNSTVVLRSCSCCSSDTG